MRLSEHFSLEELTLSETASRLGLDNTPGSIELENLRRLAEGLELVRELLGHPVIITSGYRSPAVNASIGGTANSHHCQGLAADFIAPAFGPPVEVARFLAESGLGFDQLIHEHEWIHISFATPARRQVLTLAGAGGYVTGIVA